MKAVAADEAPDLGALGPLEVRNLARALRRPVGRYTYERAAHLAGVPQRTLHHWAREGIFVPDFGHLRPKQWSYRDLVLVRLFVWLRQEGQKPADASQRVAEVRQALTKAPKDTVPYLHADRHSLLVGEEEFDRLSGEQVLAGMGAYFSTFDFTEALPEAPKGSWGPNLVRPSAWTSILPLVMAGEPCIRTTRITTANVWTLRHHRGLDDEQIAALYPGIEVEQVADAISLEAKLRPTGVAA
jgi:uncharacterized protein (DUF433 family)